jgi:hypothetical protein
MGTAFAVPPQNQEEIVVSGAKEMQVVENTIAMLRRLKHKSGSSP